jgi:hypothetical protein
MHNVLRHVMFAMVRYQYQRPLLHRRQRDPHQVQPHLMWLPLQHQSRSPQLPSYLLLKDRRQPHPHRFRIHHPPSMPACFVTTNDTPNFTSRILASGNAVFGSLHVVTTLMYCALPMICRVHMISALKHVANAPTRVLKTREQSLTSMASYETAYG